MAYYRTISLSFWTDSKVDDNFTPEDKYFYLYLLTNPHTNICGCYEISHKQMERETGYNLDTVKRLLGRMEKEHRVIAYSEETKEVLILNWHKYNWTRSEKVLKSVRETAQYIKNSSFKEFIEKIIENPLQNQYQYQYQSTECRVQSTDVSIGYGYPIDTVSENKGKAKRFAPPTLEEVKAYCSERNNSVDAQRFIDYYTSNGWKVGKNPMKDWKAAVRNWERDNKPQGKPKDSSYDIDEWEKFAESFDLNGGGQ